MSPPTLRLVAVGAAMGTLWLGVIPVVNGLVCAGSAAALPLDLTGIAFLSISGVLSWVPGGGGSI